MSLEISLVILNVVLLIIAVFSIPFLFQFWRMTKHITIAVQTLNRSLPGIMQSLEEITSNIVSAAQTANSHIEGLSSAIRKVQVILDIADNLLTVIMPPFFKKLVTLSAVLKGAQAFWNVFRSVR